MTAFKSFKSLVQLQHQEGTSFKVVGDSRKLPLWLHPDYLDGPETVYVDAWLVEKMFGKDGKYIPRVECVTRTVLQVNQWKAEEEAEILIFGPPDYQKDVSQMISNLVDYFCKQTGAQQSLHVSIQPPKAAWEPVTTRINVHTSNPSTGRQRPGVPSSRLVWDE
uniref:KH-like RNA-binding domain-containing protein n=1 Tax=Peromyscus maniculatus bairdii TaxID=230844 RepID=A0A8C8UP63_PERMB